MAIACAIGWTSCISGGAPILRQDWPTPYLGFGAALEKISGWDPSGIGGATGPSSSFALVPLLALAASAVGPRIAEILFVFSIALLCAFASQSCVRIFSDSLVARIAAPIFALFNPWVYTKFVAGHMFMLLSYGGLMLFAREALKAGGSQFRLMICGLTIGPQTQFFVLCFLPAMYLTLVRRQRLATIVWALLALPEIVAVLLNRNGLLGIPLTLTWENSQSIDPTQALLLTGYFTRYAAAFVGFPVVAMWTIFGLAVIGCIAIAFSDRHMSALPLVTIAAVLLSFGTLAPWGWLVQLAFEKIPEMGLFRELFDFLGISAVGYLALCSCASRRVRGSSFVWLAASACLVAPWFWTPPQTFWVAAQDVPQTSVPRIANTRFALLPAFQPMSFRGRGSGIDPDLYPRAGNVTPLNENFPLYPIGPALQRYAQAGDTRALAALSVSCILTRPWFETDDGGLAAQRALPSGAIARRTSGTTCITALPELTVSPLPRVGTLDTNIGAGNVFFGDAHDALGADVPPSWGRFGGVVPVSPTNRFVDAKDGWVDARLAFTVDPDISQEFGGALTVNRDALLDVRAGLDALVFVRGALNAASGRTLVRATRGYAWVHIPANVRTLRCTGLCVVALQGTPPHLPENPPGQVSKAVSFRAYTPWFVVATMPAGPPRLLRYNVAYSGLWTARAQDMFLPHVRIDGIVNGWLSPALARPARVYLIQIGAFGIACAELISLAGIIVAFAACIRKTGPSRTREGLESRQERWTA